MACFITPLVVGLAVGILCKVQRSSSRLGLSILSYLLLGGAILLAIEHAWHGEVVPYPPYLTALQSAGGETSVILREIGAIGGSMTLATVALWLTVLHTSKRIKTKITPPTKIATVVSAG